MSRYTQTTSPLWFGISKVLPSSSIQVQATKKWCERCYRVKGPRVRDCHITSTSKHGKGSRWNKTRLHTAGRQTTCVWHRFLRITPHQACASGWGGGKVVQYRSKRIAWTFRRKFILYYCRSPQFYNLDPVFSAVFYCFYCNIVLQQLPWCQDHKVCIIPSFRSFHGAVCPSYHHDLIYEVELFAISTFLSHFCW